MEASTIGRNFHTGMIVPLWQKLDERFHPLEGEPRFRLVLIEKGTGILRAGNRRSIFNAPTVFCLNELDQPELERSEDLQARALYFHPRVINQAFDLERIRRAEAGFSLTEYQDLLVLRAFLSRDDKYFGQLTIGPAAAKRIAGLFDTVHQGLTSQNEEFWPCRSRSYFLETLFLVERLYSAPENMDDTTLPENPTEADSLLIYLHTHYQERITIADLCRIFNLNRTSLNERFSAVTSMPIMAYLINLRVRLAAQMLRDTTLPVNEVMDRVGFNDLSHFGRIFRRQTGMSPSAYRQRYCWML